MGISAHDSPVGGEGRDRVAAESHRQLLISTEGVQRFEVGLLDRFRIIEAHPPNVSVIEL